MSAAPLKEQHYYPVLEVSIDDYQNAYDWLGDDQDEDANKSMELARSLSDSEWRALADYISDFMYDGDQWDEAMRFGLEHVRALLASELAS